MARYAFPPTLFPASDLVQQWHQEGCWTPFEREVRAAAYRGYVHENSFDKELNRFMVPHLEWLAHERDESCYKQLGKYSWSASPDKAPFIPPQCTDFLASSFEGSRSLMHLIGASFSRMRIIYVAEDLELVLDDCEAREFLLFVVEENNRVTVIDKKDSLSFQARAIAGTIGMNSSVSWMSEQRGLLVQHDQWRLEKNATMKTTQVLYESNESWIRKEYKLGEAALMSYTFLGALTADDQCTLSTLQEHQGSASTSSVLVKTVGTDDSRSFYRGTIKIDSEAAHSKAHQHQRALLLTQGARTCAIPSLEVLIHEVQCSHGSAVGQFDEAVLHYLQSRGLQIDHAKQLIIEGFFSDSLSDQQAQLGKQLLKGLF